MRFGNLRSAALAIFAVMLVAPSLAAQTDIKPSSKQGLAPRTPPTRTALNLRATSSGPGVVNLQWDTAPDVVSYRIERAKQTAEGNVQFFVIIDRHPTNSFTDTGLWNAVTYWYRVSTLLDPKAAATSQTSSVVEVTIAP